MHFTGRLYQAVLNLKIVEPSCQNLSSLGSEYKLSGKVTTQPFPTAVARQSQTPLLTKISGLSQNFKLPSSLFHCW